MPHAPQTGRLAILHSLKMAGHGDYIRWAMEQVLQGEDAREVLWIAGLDESDDGELRDAREYFSRYCGRQGICVPPERDALLAFARVLCREILEGVSPAANISKLSELYCQTEHQHSFLSIWSELEDDFLYLEEMGRPVHNTDLSPENRDCYVKEFARQYLELTEHALPDGFFRAHFCLDCRKAQSPAVQRAPRVLLPKIMYRWLHMTLPAAQLECPGCGSRNIVSLGDFSGRKAFLESHAISGARW